MRKPILAGNWKMNTTVNESAELAESIKKQVQDVKDREIIFGPPFTSLETVIRATKGSNIQVAAQNLYFEDKGAFTGEISGPMIKAIGCSHVIIGHSERRQYFGETNETVNKRIKAGLKHGLLPIVCIGETLAEREADKTFNILEKQLKEGLASFSKEEILKMIIAYEPVWAIGTGKTATKEQAQEVHAFIRKLLAEIFDKNTADSIRILYGGSVKPDNIKELMEQPDLDGALVGGASLKPDSFVRIIKF